MRFFSAALGTGGSGEGLTIRSVNKHINSGRTPHLRSRSRTPPSPRPERTPRHAPHFSPFVPGSPGALARVPTSASGAASSSSASLLSFRLPSRRGLRPRRGLRLGVAPSFLAHHRLRGRERPGGVRVVAPRGPRRPRAGGPSSGRGDGRGFDAGNGARRRASGRGPDSDSARDEASPPRLAHAANITRPGAARESCTRPTSATAAASPGTAAAAR